MATDFKKAKANLGALSSLRETLADQAVQHPAVIDGGIFDQVAAEIEHTRDRFPELVPAFDRAGFVSHVNIRGTYYRLPQLQALVGVIIGRLEAAIEEMPLTTDVPQRGFDYVRDPGIRAIVARDYAEIHRAAAASCWKSVIILSGGAIEALLLDRLGQNPAVTLAAAGAPKGKDLAKWDLADLINVAVELHVVGDGANRLSHAVRQYRNLVHPGNELRSSLRFGSEEATIAREVLHIVDRDLGG